MEKSRILNATPRLLAPCLLALLPATVLRAAEPPTFFGPDLAVVGTPYSLRLPAGADCEVNWGDGVVERIAGKPATHVFQKPAAAEIAVKMRQANGTWAVLPLDSRAEIQQSDPALFLNGPVAPGASLPTVLKVPADSFSVECRVWFDNPVTDQVLLVGKAPSGCSFGIQGGQLFFQLLSGSFTAPLDGRLTVGKWHHLAVTYDRVPLFPRSNKVRLFVDGQLIGEGTIAADDAGAVNCPSAVAAPGLKGKLAALAVYDDLLFPLEIRDHAQVLAGDNSLALTVATRGAAEVIVDPPAITNTVDIPLNPDPKADNGPALRKAISAAGPGTRLRLVNQADPGKGGTFYVRSMIENPKWSSLLVENKTDFEVDGNGSTIIISDKAARYLLVDNCLRVAVRNLSFDLDQSYARVGMYFKLLDVDPSTRVIKAQQVHGDGSPDPVIPRRAKYWRWRSHDPKTLRIGGGGPFFDNGSYAEPPVADPASGPGVMRFKLKQAPDDAIWPKLKAFQAGANFYMVNNADFSSNAVSLMRSSHITFDHVNYYATLGMVFLSSSLDHLHITHCKIGLPPGLTARDRPLASGADGYHFHLTRGDILFENNEITLTDDDPVSLKDSIWLDIRKVGDNQLSIGQPQPEKKRVFDVLVDDSQKAGIRGKESGVPVELLNPDYSPTGYTARVTSVTGNILTLDKPAPADVKEGSFLMNRSHHTQNWILRNNYLHDYYGRVMLYTDYGTVIHNRVHNSYYHLGNSTAYFEVAGACRNVITHDNLFDSTTADSSHWGGDRTLPSFHEITYSANSFMGKGLSINNAAGSLITRNGFYGKDAGLSVKRSVDTLVADNLGFTTSFEVQTKENTGVILTNNRSVP